MIHTVDPRQNRLFDPFDGVIPPVGRRIIADGWQGVVRHVLLEVLPVNELGRHFSYALGAPPKELYSMAGLVFLADFFGWTPQDALEAYIFRSDVQYALNLEPGAAVSTRSLERYQKLFRDDELAARVFDDKFRIFKFQISLAGARRSWNPYSRVSNPTAEAGGLQLDSHGFQPGHCPPLNQGR